MTAASSAPPLSLRATHTTVCDNLVAWDVEIRHESERLDDDLARYSDNQQTTAQLCANHFFECMEKIRRLNSPEIQTAVTEHAKTTPAITQYYSRLSTKIENFQKKVKTILDALPQRTVQAAVDERYAMDAEFADDDSLAFLGNARTAALAGRVLPLQISSLSAPAASPAGPGSQLSLTSAAPTPDSRERKYAIPASQIINMDQKSNVAASPAPTPAVNQADSAARRTAKANPQAPTNTAASSPAAPAKKTADRKPSVPSSRVGSAAASRTAAQPKRATPASTPTGSRTNRSAISHTPASGPRTASRLASSRPAK